MSDFFMQLHSNPMTAWLARIVGLPNPVPLARSLGGYEAAPLVGKIALLAVVENGPVSQALADALAGTGAKVHASAHETDLPIDVVVIDATACRTPSQYRLLYDTMHPIMRRLSTNARVLLVASEPNSLESPVAAAVARGVEGFSRSLGKELGGNGVAVNLAYVAEGAEDRLDGLVRFFCAKQTTYVSGQAVHVSTLAARPLVKPPLVRVLEGKVALVTGSARGIGLATAQRLAQEGAQVVCLDVPGMQQELEDRCQEFGAIALPLDIASAEAPRRLADFFKERFGGVDIVVHNAGITRDRTLANMKEQYWDLVININLSAIVAVDEVLVGERVLRDEGRIVCLSSISGVAGNFGQTNYAASKAALIGYVSAQAAPLARRGICINAIAPGFIETAMTQAMPFMNREIGGRVNAFKQPGQPRDAAELITFLSSPHAYGLTGNTIRVCGHQMLGA